MYAGIKEKLQEEKNANKYWLCHSAGIAAAVNSKIVSTKLSGKPLPNPEVKLVTKYLVLCWIPMESFIGNRLNYKPASNI